MHIAIVSDFGWINGGAAKVAIASARGLAERGVSVSFISAIAPTDPSLDHPNIDLHPLGMADVWAGRNPVTAAARGVWNAATATAIAGLLAARPRKDTLIHFHQWTKAISPSGFAAPPRLGLPAAVTLHDYFAACPNGIYYRLDRGAPCRLKPLSIGCITANCDSRSYPHKLVRVVRQAASNAALKRIPSGDLTFVHVSAFARQVIERFLPADARHAVVPNPIDAKRGPPPGPPARPPGVLFIGRLVAEKGVLLLAAAAAAAGVPVTFAGTGPAAAAIAAINPHAKLLGWIASERLPDLLAETRALVFPSLWHETSGLVVGEALAAGVPAIVARGNAAAALIEDGVTGLLIEPGSPAALTAALVALADGDRASAMGAAAYRRYWAAPPDLDRHIDDLLAMYDAALATASHGR